MFKHVTIWDFDREIVSSSTFMNIFGCNWAQIFYDMVQYGETDENVCTGHKAEHLGPTDLLFRGPAILTRFAGL